MKGVSFLTDEAGERTAVVLDLRRHGRLWEDVYDRLLVEPRRPTAGVGPLVRLLAAGQRAADRRPVVAER